MKNTYIAIIAGGSGSRLWPLSRNNFTKQFITLIGNRSFLQMAYDRIKNVCPNERILVITNKKFESIIKEQLPEIPYQNIVYEPEGRDTAPAIGLAAEIVHKLDPDSLLATIGADHYITDTKGFEESIQTSFEFIEKNPNGILTIGINPTSPDTNLGYIEMGEPIDKVNRSIVFSMNSFKEKPDLETAHKFLQSWRFLWNGNYFIFSTKYLISQYEKFLPATSEILKNIANSYSTPEFENVLNSEFPKCEKIGIDYAIMEKSDSNYVLPAIFGDWVDIGNWATFKDVLVVNKEKNYSNIQNHIDLDSKDILVHSSNNDMCVATLGLEDIAVVVTKDTILVTKKSRSHELKKLLEKVPDEYK